MDWHLSLKPRASMLKFRLPWTEGKTRYLKGDIFFPIWGRKTTTESRLIVQGSELYDYDNMLYGEQMFYFNRLGRVQYHENPYITKGTDNCYDCTAEAFVVRNFLRQSKQVASCDAVASFCNGLGVACSPEGRTLAFKETRRKLHNWFSATTFDYDKRQLVTAEIHKRWSGRKRRVSSSVEPNSDMVAMPSPKIRRIIVQPNEYIDTPP